MRIKVEYWNEYCGWQPGWMERYLKADGVYLVWACLPAMYIRCKPTEIRNAE